MDLDLGDPGATERVDDLLRMDGDTTIEQETEGNESGMSLVGEGMCVDGVAALEELRQHCECIEKQNEVGEEEFMSDSPATSIGGGKKRPSPESTSPIEIDGGSVPKKSRVKRHVFTPLEKAILVNLYNTNKLKDKKDIHDVVLLLSKDDRSLSETPVKTWVDNFKSSLNRKKRSEKDTDPKDKGQE
jgi:hypothetical protein